MDSFNTPPDIVIAAVFGIAVGWIWSPLIWHLISCLWCGGDPIKQAQKIAHNVKLSRRGPADAD